MFQFKQNTVMANVISEALLISKIHTHARQARTQGGCPGCPGNHLFVLKYLI